MQSLDSAPGTQRRFVVAASVALHGLLIAALLYRGSVQVAPNRLPGRTSGTQLTLTYNPGRAAASAPRVAPKLVARLKSPAIVPQLPRLSIVGAASEAAIQPDSSTGNDGLGQGDISIALMQFFPDPKPDLSELPPGTKGDVILYAVIGADGKIEHLTLTRGLGHGVDESVIATVQQWTFHPATRDGHPVPSEQEFHFHYERS